MQANDPSLALIAPAGIREHAGNDIDLSMLNRLYLAKAREMAHAGAQKKACYLLGLPADALEILAKMPLSAVNALTESGILLFGWRTALTTLKDFSQRSEESTDFEELRFQLLASQGSDGRGRVSHGRDLA